MRVLVSALDILHRRGHLLRCHMCTTVGLQVSGSGAEGAVACDSCGEVTFVVDGIWDAMGPHRPGRSLTVATNVAPFSPWLYEPVWRPY